MQIDQVRYGSDPDYRARCLEIAEIREELTARRARVDKNVFMEYVFEFPQQPFHRYLQHFFDSNKFASMDCPPESGKTFQVSIGRTLWQLGNNPANTIGLISNSADIPEDCLNIIKDRIESSDKLHRVFPQLRIDKFKRTKTGNQYLTVERPKHLNIKDPSLIAMSIDGNIVGRRWSIVKTDDIQDLENTWTDHSRNKLIKNWEMQVAPRLLAEAPHEDIGTPFHINDLRHHQRSKPGYAYVRCDHWTGGVYELGGKEIRNFGDTLWPTPWRDPATHILHGMPRERLIWKSQNTPELEFLRLYRCMSMTDTMSAFKPEDIEYAKSLGLRLGVVSLPARADDEEVVVSGCDLAVSKDDAADRYAIHTLTYRDGPHGLTKVTLDIRAGHWTIREFMRNVLEVLRLYPGHRGFRVETNAAQDYMRQALEDDGMARAIGFNDSDILRLKIIPHNTTGQNKSHRHFGINAMGLDFQQKRWAVPCGEGMVLHPEVKDWIGGLLSFSPADHTNDNVMASWLASEQLRRTGIGGSAWDELGIA